MLFVYASCNHNFISNDEDKSPPSAVLKPFMRCIYPRFPADTLYPRFIKLFYGELPCACSERGLTEADSPMAYNTASGGRSASLFAAMSSGMD